ncbi:unnamed protein product [Gulo gulo]|uniref:Glyceraldehyde-3-phosphate dehydrogenase n=1 Tax=Gulo gulo TaxID=48420 RepID=A0A9X9LFJ7_GULGU|nr:unnamed protein product [Gulo gulo]
MVVMGMSHEKNENSKLTTMLLVLPPPVCPCPAKVIHDSYSIVEVLMTTVHAITTIQNTADDSSGKLWHDDQRDAQNISPASTGTTKLLARLSPS